MRGGVGSWSGEESSNRELLGIIEAATITKEDDSWKYGNGGVYTVSSHYLYLYAKFLPPTSLTTASIESIRQIWRSWAPSKVVVFSWQALLDRLPSKANLLYRGVIRGEAEA
ncbi:serine/threonine protein kinase ATM, partial [Trifolium medium]|nr:serine/threonine protein kinase ATM [Trifolium medium]